MTDTCCDIILTVLLVPNPSRYYLPHGNVGISSLLFISKVCSTKVLCPQPVFEKITKVCYVDI